MTTPETIIKNSIKTALAGNKLPAIKLFSNPSGMAKTASGSWIRYGLQIPGSADMIGWRKIKITKDMVGMDIAQFLAVEVKQDTGKVNDKQINFLGLVNVSGGIGVVVHSADELIEGMT